MNIRNVAKGFLGSNAKRIACLSIAAAVWAAPLASYADNAPVDSVDQRMAPVSTVSESDVLNILVPSPVTSQDPEQIAAPQAEYTDISQKPASAAKGSGEESKDIQKSGGRMSRLRKMASRVRSGRDKKAIASADIAKASEEKKADASEAVKPEAETKDTASQSTPKATTETIPAELTKASSDAQSPSQSNPTPATISASPEKETTGQASAEKNESTAAAQSVSSSTDATTMAPSTDAAATAEEGKGEKNEGAEIAFGLPGTLSDLENASKLSPDGILVVDNDEAVEQNDHLEYEDMPMDEGKTKIKIGARFPVVISSALNSKTAKKGDRIEARLKYDLKIGDKLIAKKGSVVRGHINYALKARTILHSMVSPERWYRNSGCIGIDFDEIINENGEHIPCAAAPARAGRVIKNKAEGRELGVNHNGQVTGPWAQQIRYKAVRVGLNFAMAPAGVFSFGAMPVALGLIGAANPNFAFAKPVGLNVRHRRLKGFAWGFLSGIPGSWLIEDTTIKGQEAIIKPGDEFYAAFKQEFNGEPESDASILAGASTKVKGQVIKEPASKKKKK